MGGPTLTLRVLPALILITLAFAAVPAPVDATHPYSTVISTATTSPTNYAWREVTPGASAHDCVQWEFWANTTSVANTGWAAGFWAGGDTTFVSAFLIHQPSQYRIILHTGASQTLIDGFPTTAGSDTFHVDLGKVIGPVCGAIKRVGFVATQTANAHVKWKFNYAAGVVNSGSGSDGFMFSRENFIGTWAEYVPFGNPIDAGASASLVMTKSVNTGPGLMAGFVTTANYAVQSVQGPTGFTQPYGTCVGSVPTQRVLCDMSSGDSFGSVGKGRSTHSPAGTYTFRIERAATASGLHVFVVGAPFNW